MTHDALQQKCFTWHWNNRPHERGRLWMNHNNPKNRIHGAILRSMGLLRGVYDLSFMHPNGQMLFIEIKTGTGRLSEHQKRFREIAIATGHQCVTVRSFDEFKSLFHVERPT